MKVGTIEARSKRGARERIERTGSNLQEAQAASRKIFSSRLVSQACEPDGSKCSLPLW